MLLSLVLLGPAFGIFIITLINIVIKVYLGSKFCSLLWKTLVFEFLLGIPKTLPCSVSGSSITAVPLLDARQLLFLLVDIFRTKTVSLNNIL
jgi:hypothetical protein